MRYELWQRRFDRAKGKWGPYEVTYEGEVEVDPSRVRSALEDLFRIFNIEHPPDFRGHSMSVGDIVVIAETSWQVQRAGWEAVEHPTEQVAETYSYFR